jgi:hypothetical protein
MTVVTLHAVTGGATSTCVAAPSTICHAQESRRYDNAHDPLMVVATQMLKTC